MTNILSNTDHTPATGSHGPLRSGPILVYGFASVVVMWSAWLLANAPGVHLPPAVVAAVLVLTLAACACAAGFSVARGGAGSIAPLVGAGAGTLSSIINLLLFASVLARQSAPGSKPAEGLSGLAPSALIYIPGFVLAGALIGLISGALGGMLGRTAPPSDRPFAGHDHWLARFAIITSAGIVLLIALGGMVTSSASGMAVPGWPDSYGANMFLYPISLMSQPRIFLEHSHRLFGAMVGLCVLTQLIYTLCIEKRRWVRGWMVIMFAAVCGQGILGGLRVLENHRGMAMIHGIIAQLFFAISMAAVVYLSLAYRQLKSAPPDHPPASEPTRLGRKRRVFAIALLHVLMVQLVMGAWFRHFGVLHPLYTHIVIAVGILFLGFISGMLFRTTEDLPPPAAGLSRRIGAAMLACLVLQFTLGWGAFAMVGQGPDKQKAPTSSELDTSPTPPLAQTLIATAHQTNGALLLGLSAAGAVLARAAARRR